MEKQVKAILGQIGVASLLILAMLISASLPSGALAKKVSAGWQRVDTTGKFRSREEASFVSCVGRIYLLGGRGIQAVDIYDPKTGSWSAGAAPPIEIHHFQAVAWQNRIYLVGAMTGRYPTEAPIGNILIYDPLKDMWSTGDAIPPARRRGSAGVAIHDGKLYLTAGIKNGHTDGWVKWFDSYDFATKRWTQLPDAPHARDHFEAAEVDGKLYAIGGRRSSFVTNQTLTSQFPKWTFSILPRTNGQHSRRRTTFPRNVQERESRSSGAISSSLVARV